MYFWVGVLQSEAKLKFLCRQKQIAAQERSRGYLEQLFKKNPMAQKLRTQFELAEAALALAISSSNPPAIGAAQIRLDLIKFRRAALDLTQKALIQAANADLKISSLGLYQQMQREASRQRSLLSSFLEIHLLITPSQSPILAVVPAYPDIAPPYRTQPGFSERQAMEQKWQYRFRIVAPLNQFLKGEAIFKKESRITLAGENEQWRIENLRGKSWSKP